MNDDRSVDWESLIEDIADDVRRRQTNSYDDSAEPLWAELRRRLRTLAATKRLNRFGLDVDEVEDVVQDVLFRLQNTDMLRRVRSAKVIPAYLATTLRNEASNAARKKMHQFDIAGAVARSGRDPVDAAMVRDLLNSLTPAERQLIEMKFWEGKTLKEIGARLGIRPGTAGVRVFRLLAKLKDRLGYDKPN